MLLHCSCDAFSVSICDRKRDFQKTRPSVVRKKRSAMTQPEAVTRQWNLATCRAGKPSNRWQHEKFKQVSHLQWQAGQSGHFLVAWGSFWIVTNLSSNVIKAGMSRRTLMLSDRLWALNTVSPTPSAQARIILSSICKSVRMSMCLPVFSV